ncbi:DUF4236 domain-containing protein [Mucilaginibacter gossypii]|uniref:DUF4236 domain-containing protein n=1 Tax=Mucilaginibacter gossypii TaxID=551996 RepID=A0A1G8A634_9SPHI|nr:DUF4236 domain-containing protein [Mucilaginibacter gossypii]SDH16399.1 Protein of unknown function [Mucilaginibacter gossypii]
MSWSYRKSFGSGPFRVNFSKSGISYSMGVKGARVNVGPKGTFVSLSAHGITYRRKLQGPASAGAPEKHRALAPVMDKGHDIASAAIGQLTDTDSMDFVAELTRKAGLIAYVNWLGILPLLIFIAVMLWTSFGSRTVVRRPARDSISVIVTSYEGVNIRKRVDAGSDIVRAAVYDEAFRLTDSTNTKWVGVGFHDSTGYINRRFVRLDHVPLEAVAETQVFLANPYAVYEFLFGILVFTVLIRWLRKLDKERFEMELHYDMDPQFRKVYEQFGVHFARFSGSAKIWQYLNAQQTSDYKRNAGAGKLIKRKSLRGVFTNKAPLPYFITNVSTPCLKLNTLEFYFLPERLLIREGNKFAAVFYKNLRITGYTTRFIENEWLPPDAQVIDQTWRYVNKRGGPDRRFNNNRQIPVCAYSEYILTSDTGIYEIISTSKKGAMDDFASFLGQIGNLQARMPMG